MSLPLPPHSDPSQERQTPQKPGGFKMRAMLLGTAAVLALGGAYAGHIELPRTSFTSPAQAEPVTPPPITVTPTAQTSPQAPSGFADIVDRVKGAVVSIKVKMTATAGPKDTDMPDVAPGSPLYRFFKRFGGQLPFEFREGHPHVELAQGSGFFISPDGYIVTNNHVVEHATDVKIVMEDGKILPAKVIGTDKKTDLALLKVKTGSNYPYVQFAPKTPRVGDWVLAVGNPFGLGGTVTAGIVSARGRDIGAGPYDDFLQIDAPVNRGNSGGPAFNMQGQVVGVNTAIYSPSGGSVGIGFAIPSDVVQNVVTALKDHGKVTRGWIGVEIQPVTPDIAESLGVKSTKGALVAEVQPNGPAKAAGIKPEDIIESVNGDKVSGPRELARKIAELGPKAKANLEVWRNGSDTTLTMTLGTLPHQQEAKAEIAADTGSGALSSYGLTLSPAEQVPGAGKKGVVVTAVDPDGSAAQKGLKVGDVIVEAGGKAVTSPGDISTVLSDAKKEGRKAILLRVKNGQETHFVALAVNPAT
ncbi:Do family serine endopeptidase [Methylovirgula sp. HY1]|uniref:Do family serine endopeptidase n=1 Tax=Methylovirgula sp. HY1 TaxID=2822761 RepID=UPI001C5B8FC3|nr:Do family serine endopeptidase [Methylovirgula sp. HY1]QXX73517.1 Periplasmic serine endoprotease DegP [Methylovirgula sp. HY1]